MKAVLDGVVIAEAPEEELISIEGNWYFPPEAVTPGALVVSPTPYTCPWKGAATYYTVNGLEDRAWSYHDPRPTAVARVGRDFARYVAFWRGVEVID
ncbi:DUF427 domain-containing protein [Microbacterium sp. ASV49]|uniref:DUF427 domain-containing protein n=1 Tax=Microbacterium candidum TaxID=3041922 RepID=A0ABT7N1U2_9MICO|nr:DUF427 domain-containing protein [Microbacterium sp. ASV49]MDL9980675.1 DUF427 domain-containing protein [Microbacterium sp. ASV49]